MSSLVALAVVLVPRLALLLEWPAQWLALAAHLLHRGVATTVSETSIGGSYAKSGLNEVFLASVPAGQRVYLRLTPTQGGLSYGSKHM